MLTRTTIALAGSAAIAAGASQCDAAFTNVIGVDETSIQNALLPGSVAPGRTLWRIYAVFSNPMDVMLYAAHTNWGLTSALYQDQLGGDTPPNPALFGMFPLLAGDSFVTIDALTQPSDTAFDPDWAAVGGGFQTPNQVHGGWYDGNPLTHASAGPDGRVLIAQLNLANGAVACPFFGEIFWLSNGTGNAIQSFYTSGCPSPGALGISLLAAAASGPRRNREQARARRA